VQENLTSINALVLLGLAAGQAMAGTVQLTQPNPITTNGATTLYPNLVGTLFTDGDPSLAGIQSVDGAAFAFSWDPTVLQYTGSVVTDPNWDIASIDDAAALADGGSIDLAFLARSAGFFGSDFDIIDLSLNAIGAAGTATDITFEDVFGGWSLGGVPVDYVAGQVAVTTVPEPAAAWLFGSGLIGLVGVAKRRSA